MSLLILILGVVKIRAGFNHFLHDPLRGCPVVLRLPPVDGAGNFTTETGPAVSRKGDIRFSCVIHLDDVTGTELCADAASDTYVGVNTSDHTYTDSPSSAYLRCPSACSILTYFSTPAIAHDPACGWVPGLASTSILNTNRYKSLRYHELGSQGECRMCWHHRNRNLPRLLH